MAQQINAKLQATVRINADFSQARREIARLIPYTRSAARYINRTLNKAFDIKKKIAQIKPVQAAIPTRRVTIREILKDVPSAFLQARGVERARSRSGFSIGTPQIPRRNISREEAEAIAREYKKTLPVPQQLPPVRQQRAPMVTVPRQPQQQKKQQPITTTQQPQQQRAIQQKLVSKSEIDVNLKVDVTGGTTAGTAENMVEKMFKSPSLYNKFQNEVEKIVRKTYNKIRLGE